MTSEKLAELEALFAKATAGEWYQPDGGGGHVWNNDADEGEGQVPDRLIVMGPNKPSWVKDRTPDEWLAANADNLAFIAAIKTNAPALFAAAHALAAVTAERDRMAKALRGVIDDDPCYYDHHGYCQAHFVTSPCEMAIARAALEGTPDGRK